MTTFYERITNLEAKDLIDYKTRKGVVRDTLVLNVNLTDVTIQQGDKSLRIDFKQIVGIRMPTLNNESRGQELKVFPMRGDFVHFSSEKPEGRHLVKREFRDHLVNYSSADAGKIEVVASAQETGAVEIHVIEPRQIRKVCCC